MRCKPVLFCSSLQVLHKHDAYGNEMYRPVEVPVAEEEPEQEELFEEDGAEFSDEGELDT
jgi:hypothetical protein